MLTTFLSSLAGKLAIASVALATTTGGLAATGNLPDPVQDWSASQLAVIGVEIPSGAEVEVENDTAAGVLEVIDGTNPEDRDQAFGEEVADTASDGNSTDGLNRADEAAENAGEHGDIADEKTEGVPPSVDDVLPTEADAGLDGLPAEAGSGGENAEQGAGFLP